MNSEIKKNYSVFHILLVAINMQAFACVFWDRTLYREGRFRLYRAENSASFTDHSPLQVKTSHVLFIRVGFKKLLVWINYVLNNWIKLTLFLLYCFLCLITLPSTEILHEIQLKSALTSLILTLKLNHSTITSLVWTRATCILL